MRAGDDLKDAFAWKEERRLSQALTPQYDNVIFVLEPSEPAKAAIGKYVTVFDYPDGRLSIRHNGVELAYRTFNKMRNLGQGAIADNKRLGRYERSSVTDSYTVGPSVAVGRADATGTTPGSSRSAKRFYEPNELSLAEEKTVAVASYSSASICRPVMQSLPPVSTARPFASVVTSWSGC